MHVNPKLPRARARLIRQLARALIAHFGTDAFAVASQQAQAAGGIDGTATKSWKEVALEIKTLQTLSDSTATTIDRNLDDSEHIGEDAGRE